MLDVDDVIAEVAKRNGIALTRDDPILVMATLHDRLLQATAEQQKGLLAEFKEEIGRTTDQLSGQAIQRAQAIVREAVKAARDAAVAETERELRGLGGRVCEELARTNATQNRLQWLFVLNLTAVLLLAAVMVMKV
jgi:hypothetical protein